jgi:hypothetical protein
MTMAAFQDAGPAWAAAGIVPLPLGGVDGKRPLIKGPAKLGRHAALQLAPKFPDAGLGFWCGRRNGLTVVDIDSTADAELQYAIDTYGDSPVIVKTASGKAHCYYHHAGETRRIRPDKDHPIDILGEGGLAVAPPSTRPSGGRYEFLRGGLADLRSLPTIRPGALVQRELVRPEAHRSAGRVSIGNRNNSMFLLACGLAHTAEGKAGLLDQVRKANAELASPLPDDELQRAVGSAWRYREEGRLMVPGSGSATLLPSASIASLLAAGETDAMALLALLRKAHQGRHGKPFAASPEAMERARLIGSWGKRRYREATRKLCEAGELVQIVQGGNGKHTPSLYRFNLRGLD